MISTNTPRKFKENPAKRLQTFTTNRVKDEKKDSMIGELRGPTLFKGKMIQAGRPLENDTRADIKRITAAEIHAKIQAVAHPTHADVKKKAVEAPFKDDVPGAPAAADPALSHVEEVPEKVAEPIVPEDLTAPPPPAEPFVAAPSPAPEKKARKRPGPKPRTRKAKKP